MKILLQDWEKIPASSFEIKLILVEQLKLYTVASRASARF